MMYGIYSRMCLSYPLQALWWSGSPMGTLWPISKREVDSVSCLIVKKRVKILKSYCCDLSQPRGDPSILCIKYAPQWQYVLYHIAHFICTKHRPYRSKYAHEMNITHRDLKPENILLSFRLAINPSKESVAVSTSTLLFDQRIKKVQVRSRLSSDGWAVKLTQIICSLMRRRKRWWIPMHYSSVTRRRSQNSSRNLPNVRLNLSSLVGYPLVR